jgi:K+-transporting ATPase KdpF subunit
VTVSLGAGLIVALGLAVYFLAALLFPERF